MAFWKKIGRTLFYSEIRAIEQAKESQERLRQAFSRVFGAQARARGLEREKQRYALTGSPEERFRRMVDESELDAKTLDRRRQDVRVSKYIYWFGVAMMVFILGITLSRMSWGWAIFLLPFIGMGLAIFISGVAYFALMEEQLHRKALIGMRQFVSSPGFWRRLFF